jgi:hypothetical protein
MDKTIFDDSNNRLLLKIINKHLAVLYNLIKSNPEIINKYVEKVLKPSNDNLKELHFKIDPLFPKNKKQIEVRLLRDPVDVNLFALFLANASLESK